MKAGRLRHRITIQQRTVTNVGEATTEAWTTFAADVPAEIRPLSGKEVAAAGSRVAAKLRAFVIRYGNSVGADETMRIVSDANFDIVSITPDETLRDHVVLIGEARRDG